MRNKNIIIHHLSNVLEQLMKQKGMTDNELASKTNLPTSSITKLRLKYSANPTIETILPIAEYFGIDVEQLLGRKPIEGIELALPQPKTASFEVPMIEMSEIQDWLSTGSLTDEQKRQYIVTGTPVSDRAFALTVKGSMITPIFQEGAILIFDKQSDISKIEDCGYVAVILEKKEKKTTLTPSYAPHPLPTLKQIRFDGDDIFLSPFNPSLGGLLTNPKCAVLAVMRQVQITF